MSTESVLSIPQEGVRTRAARATLSALAWNYSSAVVGTVVQLCYTAYTGRTVRPGAYGAYMTASSTLTILGYFASAGMVTYVLRDERLTRQKVRTAWTVSVASGTLCCAVVQLGAPLMAAAWQLPGTVPLLRLCGVFYLVQPAAAVAVAALRRLGQARYSALTDLLAQGVGMTSGVVLLAAGWNPAGMVAAPVVTAVVTLAVSGVRLARATFEEGPRVRARSLVGLSGAFAGYGLIESLTGSTPLWATARVLGPASVGQFSRASVAVGLPLTLLCQSLYRAVTPTVARINGEGRPLGDTIRDVLGAASAVAFVCFGAAASLGPYALRILLGSGWEEASRLVPVLCVGAAGSLLYSTGCSLDEVRKAMRHLLRLHLSVFAATSVAVVAAASITRDLVVIAAAAAAATGLGHGLQLLRWHRERLFRLSLLLRPYLVHAAIGIALYASGRVGAALADSPVAAIVYGLTAMAPVALVCLALRRRLPLYEAAVARGLAPG